MQFETEQKTSRGSAPRKWNGTKGGHFKHGWRTKFDLLTAEHSLPHLFPKRRKKTIFPGNQEENSLSKTGEETIISKTGKKAFSEIGA